ncbi:MAG: HAD-IB family hydrolase [Eubacteriales bacterium]|nr:HAD-IB family hydrolase [Eubacteriales bacterium]MDD3881638.1 HAD-IB family hydrolase [Eubacteriales bacterium]MDD4512303.1 HAD-IB family hydrolase [Eubacteriales bacterium]
MIKLALYDFDKTLVAGDTILPFCRYAYKKRFISLKMLVNAFFSGLLYLIKVYDEQRAKAKTLSMFRSISAESAFRFGEEFFVSELKERLFRDGLAAIEADRRAGRRIVVVSASPEIYVSALKTLGYADEVISTRLASVAGVLTGDIDGRNCKGAEKAKRIAAYLENIGETLDYDQSAAYGDGLSDAYMLEMAAGKTLVNPKKALIKRFPNATVAHWE